jgi:hypothetical protein
VRFGWARFLKTDSEVVTGREPEWWVFGELRISFEIDPTKAGTSQPGQQTVHKSI